MKIYTLLIILAAFVYFGGTLLFNGCAASAEYNPSKMDTSLNQRITSSDNESSDKDIQFTGKTTESINDQMRSKSKKPEYKLKLLPVIFSPLTGMRKALKKSLCSASCYSSN